MSVVLPCLNEEGSIASCIAEARVALSNASLESEIIVVDNGSSDASAEVASANGARVVVEPRRGYGAAVQRGVAEARAPIVVMADADSTYDLTAIPRLVAPLLSEEADLVIGERLESATADTMPLLHRRVGTPALSALIRRAAGASIQVSDSQSGFRAFRRDAILALGLQSHGMEYASEMLVRAAFRGYRVREVPTVYRSRIGESKLSAFRDGLRHLRLIVLLAPQLALAIPGVVIGVVGVLMMFTSLLQPRGLELAGTKWQPVFLAPVLTVVAVLLLLASAGVARFSSLSAQNPDDDASDTRWFRRVATGGAVTALAGLALDIGLSLMDFSTPDQIARRVALAGTATSALLIGAILIATGCIGLLLVQQRAYARTCSSAVGAEPVGTTSQDEPRRAVRG